ncbi:histidine acid phosphatase, partial [Ostertagia ostertagi]
MSAMSNMLGMYGQNHGAAVSNIDYPQDDGWPVGLVPIPIHTVDDDTDYVVNTDSVCNRREILWKMAKNSSKLQASAALFANLSELCGEPIGIDNFWTVRDALMIENKALREVNKWFSDDLFNRMTVVHNQIDAYENGVFNETLMINNLDVGSEIQKIRGGSMFNELYMRMVSKLRCMNSNSHDCKWINGLKYYAYSAHDTTIYAFFVIMGIQDKVIHPNGYQPTQLLLLLSYGEIAAIMSPTS